MHCSGLVYSFPIKMLIRLHPYVKCFTVYLFFGPLIKLGFSLEYSLALDMTHAINLFCRIMREKNDLRGT